MFSVKSGNYDGALKTTPYISRIWTVDLPRAAAAPHASLQRHRTVYGVWWDAPRATAGAARPRGQTPRSVPSMIRREVHRTANTSTANTFLHVQATSSPLRWPFFVRTAKTYMYVQYACSGQECLIKKSYLACNKVVETSDHVNCEVDQCRHLCALALYRVSL